MRVSYMNRTDVESLYTSVASPKDRATAPLRVSSVLATGMRVERNVNPCKSMHIFKENKYLLCGNLKAWDQIKQIIIHRIYQIGSFSIDKSFALQQL